MVNTRAKGLRVQRKAINELESKGWLVGIVERTGKFIKEKDLFGLFDLICIDKGCIRLIQIKSNSTGGMLKDIRKFSEEHDHDKLSSELWVHKDRKGWIKYGRGKKGKFGRRKVS